MTTEKFAVEKTETEWRGLLDADQFRVLREHGTERAGTSPLNYEKRTGVYHCAACDQPLFESSTKYESGSGWPSFFRPLPNAVATSTDSSHGMTRVEVHCRNCGGQSSSGRNERFRNSRSDGAQRSGPACAEAMECINDSPYRAKQSHERCDRARDRQPWKIALEACHLLGGRNLHGPLHGERIAQSA